MAAVGGTAAALRLRAVPCELRCTLAHARTVAGDAFELIREQSESVGIATGVPERQREHEDCVVLPALGEEHAGGPASSAAAAPAACAPVGWPPERVVSASRASGSGESLL